MIKNVDLADNIIRKVNDNIGVIDYFGIETYIMTTTIEGKFIRGYINVTQFAKAFAKKNENEKIKDVRSWGNRNKI